MSRKKTPAVFEPPKLWRWWKIERYYGHVLLPFKPTPVEFWWARLGAAEQPWGSSFQRHLESNLEGYGVSVSKARNMDDTEPRHHWAEPETQRILGYAAIRHLHPLQTPQKMDFSHW